MIRLSFQFPHRKASILDLPRSPTTVIFFIYQMSNFQPREHHDSDHELDHEKETHKNTDFENGKSGDGS